VWLAEFGQNKAIRNRAKEKWRFKPLRIDSR
jgi:hypothetical protein